MGEKDSGEKLLEDYADVFADIINVLAFHGERLLKEENIVSGPTASVYKDENRTLREQFRDIKKFDQEDKMILAVIGVENQSDPDGDMVFRVLGYDYTSYRTQISSGKKERYPVFSIVLYFGMKPWTAPKTLFDTFNTEKKPLYEKYLPELIANVKLNVVEIAYLPEEVREQFTSDFRIVADYFCSKREGREEEFFHNTREFKHVEEMLEFFRVFSGDHRYLEIKDTIIKKAEKGESISMSSFLDETARKSEKIGEKKGEIKGEIKAYFSLINEGLLTTEQAAEKMGITFKEFLDKVEEFSLGARTGKS